MIIFTIVRIALISCRFGRTTFHHTTDDAATPTGCLNISLKIWLTGQKTRSTGWPSVLLVSFVILNMKQNCIYKWLAPKHLSGHFIRLRCSRYLSVSVTKRCRFNRNIIVCEKSHADFAFVCLFQPLFLVTDGVLYVHRCQRTFKIMKIFAQLL